MDTIGLLIKVMDEIVKVKGKTFQSRKKTSRRQRFGAEEREDKPL